MKIIALFNLKPGASPDEYEQWAKSRDLPTVAALPSVRAFDVLRASGVLFTGAEPPYQYIEILDVTGLDEFMTDCSGEAVQALAGEMGAFTDGAVFISTEAL
ncbi:MAG: REDY-like protein HapK [Sphingomonadaceae bacterium]|nr:REDY-like protein HapK [Sphingomonadaceae bacterium]